MNLRSFVERAKVLANTFVTYAVIVSSVLGGAAVTLQAHADVPGVVKVVGWITAVAGVIGQAVKIARRVTQVPDELVGLLPPDDPDWT